MARTERRRLILPSMGEDAVLDMNGRDVGCRHYGCHGWKRPDRRSRRLRAKALLRRRPEEA